MGYLPLDWVVGYFNEYMGKGQAWLRLSRQQTMSTESTSQRVKGFMKQFRYGEKGFTLIELLIGIAILGVFAGIIIFSAGKFMGSGEVESANTELHNVQTAVMAIIVDAGSAEVTPASSITNGSSITVGGAAYALSDYVTGTIKGTYDIDANGILTGTDYPGDVTWDDTNHCWKKSD